MSKKQHTLTYERTDDMSVLSDFYCGVEEMDDFIHGNLQKRIDEIPGLESYIIREGKEIVAMVAIRESVLEVIKSDGARFSIESLEIEYLAVKQDFRDTGIGESIIKWIDHKARVDHPNCKYLSVNAYVDIYYGYTAVPFYEKCKFVKRKAHDLAETVRMSRIIR